MAQFYSPDTEGTPRKSSFDSCCSWSSTGSPPLSQVLSPQSSHIQENSPQASPSSTRPPALGQLATPQSCQMPENVPQECWPSSVRSAWSADSSESRQNQHKQHVQHIELLQEMCDAGTEPMKPALAEVLATALALPVERLAGLSAGGAVQFAATYACEAEGPEGAPRLAALCGSVEGTAAISWAVQQAKARAAGEKDAADAAAARALLAAVSGAVVAWDAAEAAKHWGGSQLLLTLLAGYASQPFSSPEADGVEQGSAPAPLDGLVEALIKETNLLSRSQYSDVVLLALVADGGPRVQMGLAREIARFGAGRLASHRRASRIVEALVSRGSMNVQALLLRALAESSDVSVAQVGASHFGFFVFKSISTNARFPGSSVLFKDLRAAFEASLPSANNTAWLERSRRAFACM